jgi:hypothetical protein
MKTLFFYATAIMVFVLLLAPSLTCALEEQIQEIKHPTELDVGKKKEEKEKKRTERENTLLD